MSRPQVFIIGFLDTKESEYAFVRDILVSKGCDVAVIDVSIQNVTALSRQATHPPTSVCEAANISFDHVQSLPRSEALRSMISGASKIVKDYEKADTLHGIIGLGGSTTTSLACAVMRGVKIGIPKMCVSTVASGDVSSLIGDSDICMMPSIVDISGTLNVLSSRILTNAASGMSAMAHAFLSSGQNSMSSRSQTQSAKHLVAVTMFGLTTPGVVAACEQLKTYEDEKTGQRMYEPVVFHCTGSGGRTMERLVEEKWFHAVLDLTTTELADEQCGGVFSAGPTRLTIPGKVGLPHLVSLGALDMCNFGALDTVPEKYRARTLHVHNPNITLLRTSPLECAHIGLIMAERLSQNEAHPGKSNLTCVVIPKRGWSGIDRDGGPFFDPEADEALVKALKAGLDGKTGVEVVEMDGHVNDEWVAKAMAVRLDEMVRKWEREGSVLL